METEDVVIGAVIGAAALYFVMTQRVFKTINTMANQALSNQGGTQGGQGNAGTQGTQGTTGTQQQ